MPNACTPTPCPNPIRYLLVKEMPPSKLPQKTQRPYTSSVMKVVGKCAAKVAVCAAHGEVRVEGKAGPGCCLVCAQAGSMQ